MTAKDTAPPQDPMVRELATTVDKLLQLVIRENGFLRNNDGPAEELQEIVGEKLVLSNRYYDTCRSLSTLSPDCSARQALAESHIADRLNDLTVLLNENRRLLSARHSATSLRVSAIMEALNDRQESLGTYGRTAMPQAANQHNHLSLVTGSTA